MVTRDNLDTNAMLAQEGPRSSASRLEQAEGQLQQALEPHAADIDHIWQPDESQIVQTVQGARP